MDHQRHRAEPAALPPTHDDGRRSRRLPGRGLAAGAGCVALLVVAGVVPVWQWLAAYAGPQPTTVWSLLPRLVVLALTGTLLVAWVRARRRGRPTASVRASGPDARSGRP